MSDLSITAYRALIANVGGFPDEGEEMRASAKALTFATQKYNIEVEGDDEHNALVDLVSGSLFIFPSCIM